MFSVFLSAEQRTTENVDSVIGPHIMMIRPTLAIFVRYPLSGFTVAVRNFSLKISALQESLSTTDDLTELWDQEVHPSRGIPPFASAMQRSELQNVLFMLGALVFTGLIRSSSSIDSHELDGRFKQQHIPLLVIYSRRSFR